MKHLVKYAQAGHYAASEHILKHMSAPLKWISRKVGASYHLKHDDVEDLFQEAQITVWRVIPKINLGRSRQLDAFFILCVERNLWKVAKSKAVIRSTEKLFSKV